MMKLVKMSMMVALSAAFTLGGCGGGELDQYGCRSDADCKHDRICVQGQCQDAGQSCRSDEECPAGEHCYNLRCLVCDADGDGSFGAQCAGPDCDDDDGSVHPEADELCGDGLDNDCDGATDPAALCDERCAGVECPAGWACDPATGDCVPTCTPDCAGKECGPDGCGEECGQCPAGQICNRQGRCQQGCEDRCNRGETACAEGGVTTCRDLDGDGCVEWSEPEPCPQGMSCDDGQCVDGCRDECDPGESYCLSDIEMVDCGQYDQDPCVEFGPPIFCEMGWCDPETGRCREECRDECWWGESMCVSEMEMAECGDFDDDPCLEFGPPMFCEEGFCDWQSGRCGGECWDECVWGESFCLSDWESVECGEWDGDACLEFGPPMPCEQGWCDWETGHCGGGCWDECEWWGQTMCWDEYGYAECGDHDGDSCLELSERMACPDGQRCNWNTGQCDASCDDECWWGESYCQGTSAFIECGEWDGDACLELGPPNQCPADQPCQDGRCGGCYDECMPGERFCWDEYGFVECGEHDGDPCFEFGPRIECPEGLVCNWELGECTEACWDECWWGEIVCTGGRRYMPCGDYDMDPCAEWGPEQRCPQGTICSDDAMGCVDEHCQDECMPGETFCWDEWTWVECGDYDQDPCFEFSPPMPCPPDAPCDWATGTCGQCQPLTCWDLGVECGSWWDGCNGELWCGGCPAGSTCSNGVCQPEGGREGAGQPCGPWQPCPNWFDAAWMCVEYPADTQGTCSYPCEIDDDCAIDFPGGCCREVAPGHRVCLPDEDLCAYDGNAYLDPCTWSWDDACLPDMFCVEDYMGNGDSYCLITCDTAMGICPLGGSCLPIDEQGSSTGVCLPTGDGQFGDECSFVDGCVSGLACLPLDEIHPGYCNTMCSDFLPCPNGFDCVLDDGSGGTWCAELCGSDGDCARLGDWECVFFGGNQGVCMPRP